MNFLIVIAAKYLYLLSITIALVWIYLKAKRQMGSLLKLASISFPISFIVAKIHHQIDIWGAVIIAVIGVYSSIRILKKLEVEIAR